MSYIDVPRIHFSGKFSADPSTVNNDKNNYASITSSSDLGWNANGKGWFFLQNCTVKTAIDSNGNAAPTDPIVGGTVETTAQPSNARLVDLDPDFQVGSQIWGAEFKISLKGGAGSLTAKLQTVGFRDLYQARVRNIGFQGFGAVYTSTLDNRTSTTVDSSPILKILSTTGGVSIKLVVYAYDPNPGATFTFGNVVGTIAPAGSADGDDPIIDLGTHFLQARRMIDAGSGAFGNVPFKLNPGKKRLTIDIGNAIPETAAAGPRFNLGDLTAEIVLPSPGTPVVLGKLDYTQGHFEQTAGVEQLTITDAQVKQLQKNPLGLTITKPSNKLVLSERPKGLYVDTTEKVFRMDSGDTASFTLVAMEFGKPKNALKLELKLMNGTPASGIKFPADVTTNSAGLGRVEIVAGDPKKPRGVVDGQVYEIGYHSGPVGPSTYEGSIFVHVYDDFPMPSPLNYASVKPILDQYAQLYPFMKLMLNLGDIAAIQARKDRILATISFPLEDPRYMPVTRDLSRRKTNALVAWLKAGCPV